jgi:surface protein
MFYKASSFSGDISAWDVSSVVRMGWMFFGASSFTGDLSGWDVSNVEMMNAMFRGSGLEGNEPAWYAAAE